MKYAKKLDLLSNTNVADVADVAEAKEISENFEGENINLQADAHSLNAESFATASQTNQTQAQLLNPREPQRNPNLLQAIDEDENDEYCSPLKQRRRDTLLEDVPRQQQTPRSERHYSPTKG